MSVAQRLYENGFITYMRTDSTTLSGGAVNAARAQVRELYGAEYLPDAPRTYASKVKNAQEAHEAIRPAGESFRTPAQTGLTGDQFRLYELIWMRTVASQMKDAVGQSVSVRIGGAAADGRDVVFGASGRVITFHGFLKAYVEGTDGGKRSDDDQVPLPDLHEGDAVSAASLSANGHETKPPARYTEATLIKELEDREIGRPSTYASIIGTILNRGYVYKKGTALVPAWLAFSVIRLLEEHFPRQISYEFTAGMEDVLDEIAGGRKDRSTELGEFYYGSDTVDRAQAAGRRARRHRRPRAGDLPDRRPGQRDQPAGRPLRPLPRGPRRRGHAVRQARQRARRPAARRAHPREGQGAARQPGRRGDRARRAPRDRACRSWPRTAASAPTSPRCCPRTRRRTPSRAPARSSSRCRSTRSPSTTPLKLLSLPRVVGADPEYGDEITAQNGRYGPYLKKGTDSRSLTSEDQLLTITLDEALRIYAQPKQRGRAAAAAPLKELGNDPVSGQPVVVKAGRFGEYVTDGEYNATLRKDDSVEAVTLERAAELLAERRAKGPAKKAAKKARQEGARQEGAGQEDRARRPPRRPPPRSRRAVVGRVRHRRPLAETSATRSARTAHRSP